MSQWVKLQPTRHQVAIAGLVSDAQTGDVIAAAFVEMTRMPESFQQRLQLKAMQYGAQWASLPQRPDQTYTAKDGSFYFVDLPDGDYTLRVTLPGVGTRYGSAQTTVTVTRDRDQIQRATAAIALPPTTLKGTIQTSDQEPIGMAKVWLEGSCISSFSNSDGQYMLTGLEVWERSPNSPPNQAPKPVVYASAPGYQTVSQGIWLSQGDVTRLDFKFVK